MVMATKSPACKYFMQGPITVFSEVYAYNALVGIWSEFHAIWLDLPRSDFHAKSVFL